MKLGHIELFTPDVDKTFEFYKLLGFELESGQGNKKWIINNGIEILIRLGDRNSRPTY